MKNLIAKQQQEISSYDFWKQINIFRTEEGEKAVRHNDFLNRVKNECPEILEYENFVVQQTKGNGVSKLEIACLNKDQCILVGMRESKKIRRRVLQYLKELESEFKTLLAREQERIQSRQTARLEYKPMNDSLTEIRLEQGKDTKFFHYCNEANLINKIVLGMTSKAYCDASDIDQPKLRDNLTKGQIKAIEYLQKSNTTLIDIGLDYPSRKSQLEKLYVKRSKQLGLIK